MDATRAEEPNAPAIVQGIVHRIIAIGSEGHTENRFWLFPTLGILNEQPRSDC